MNYTMERWTVSKSSDLYGVTEWGGGFFFVAENGLTEGVLAELERALNDHELIKVQFRLTERDDRRALIDELASVGRCELVQVIGKMALIYRKNPKPNKNLSNIHRYQA